MELKVSAARHRNLVEDFRECTASASVACYCQIDHLFEAIAIVCEQVAVHSSNYLIELSVVVLYSGTPKTKYLLLVQRDLRGWWTALLAIPVMMSLPTFKCPENV